MNKKTKSTTLVELLITILIVALMVLSFYGLATFSHKQVINADRRTKVQNSLSYCLQHMGKYVQQASGYKSNSGIQLIANGFQVRVDSYLFQNPQILPTTDLNDDVWISYTLTGHALSTSCTPVGSGSCGTFLPEVLSNYIVDGFNNSVLPVIPPYSASNGFYVVLDSSPGNLTGSSVDVGLVGRYDPAVVPTPATKLSNPQTAIQTKLICNNYSTN
jgi:Tfp pilus assembly protein PilE